MPVSTSDLNGFLCWQFVYMLVESCRSGIFCKRRFCKRGIVSLNALPSELDDDEKECDWAVYGEISQDWG